MPTALILLLLLAVAAVPGSLFPQRTGSPETGRRLSDNSWPLEIDVAEDDGLSRDQIIATLHYGANSSTVVRENKGLTDFIKWRTASVEWKPRSVAYELDGKVWATIITPEVPNTPMSIAAQSPWPCGHSFRLSNLNHSSEGRP